MVAAELRPFFLDVKTEFSLGPVRIASDSFISEPFHFLGVLALDTKEPGDRDAFG